MLLDQCCAFVDIETTGGNVQRSAITEIAVHSAQPNGEVHRWQQLFNPGQHIPEFIQRLTGITPAMVATEPFFEECAAALYEQLTDAVFIAHNARFDYGFIKAALAQCGYRFNPSIVCTVKLAKALYPEWPSYSLDNICKQLAYHRETAHRAMADVDAMRHFVEYAIADKGLEVVNAAARKQLGKVAVPVHLSQDEINALPNTAGIYQFWGEGDNLLYVGKSVRIKERVKSHFGASVKSAKEMRLAQEVRRVAFEQTAGELGALLLENQQIKQLGPVYNRRQRVYQQLFNYVLEKDDEGYLLPVLAKQALTHHSVSRYGLHRTRKQAQKWLEALAKDHALCRKQLGLEKATGACFAHQINRCAGACVKQEPVARYNTRLLMALDSQAIEKWPFEAAALFIETPKSNLAHIHVVNQWQWLGSTASFEEAEQLLSAPVSSHFDKEEYLVLRRFLHLATDQI